MENLESELLHLNYSDGTDTNAYDEIIVKVQQLLGRGSFGCVYLAVNCKTGKQMALKTESLCLKKPQLKYEYKLLKYLQHGPGIPRVYCYQSITDGHVMLMQLLGPSLEDLFNLCGRRFSITTILYIAYQILESVEYLHNKDFIHRDIKPDNFLVDVHDPDVVFMIDYGLAKRFVYSESRDHIPIIGNKNFVGTGRYASINSHLGLELSRRDDLESLGNVLVYFSQGGLPWMGLQGSQKYQRIAETKITLSIDSLCSKLPPELKTYMQYCRGLKFKEKPDYIYLRSLLLKAQRNEFKKSSIPELDWMLNRKLNRYQAAATYHAIHERIQRNAPRTSVSMNPTRLRCTKSGNAYFEQYVLAAENTLHGSKSESTLPALSIPSIHQTGIWISDDKSSQTTSTPTAVVGIKEGKLHGLFKGFARLFGKRRSKEKHQKSNLL